MVGAFDFVGYPYLVRRVLTPNEGVLFDRYLCGVHGHNVHGHDIRVGAYVDTPYQTVVKP